jgi:hypothetical protein
MSQRLLYVLAAAPLVALASLAHAQPAPASRTQPTRRPTAAPVTTRPPLKVKAPRYLLKVQIVRTADDDGGRPSTLTRANAERAIERANAIYRRNGGDVQFALHPASNFDELLQRTALNRDCILAAGQDDASIHANTDGDLDDDGQVGTAADRDLLCDRTTPTLARTEYAIQRADRIVVYSRGGNDSVSWNGNAGHWEASHPSGGASSANGYYVRMPRSFGDDTLLAHEIGHYLHTAHTFGHNPKTVAEARTMMEDYAAQHPGADPRAVFDADSRAEYAVLDTPPDPRKSLLMAVHGGDGCDTDPDKGRVTVSVEVDGQTRSYTLEPDRANVMSYFKGCAGFDHHQSKGQYAQIHAALTQGNRRSLLGAPAGCYDHDDSADAPATSQEQLTATLRKVSKCLLLARKPLPWEPVVDVYSTPSTRKAGFVTKQGLSVHPQREAALLKTVVQAELEECELSEASAALH